ncbi:hypothetical protein DFH07DRAFT_939475 [Mycena maculata]|uniref:Uncharacterized protein n=1 Tax=Mycena maculata TaxID=230809 RepID=A0AAD7JFH6_9AGAR|nr:hypothetical protein DFH07DRAFT_939475 [Mycena maculata]
MSGGFSAGEQSLGLAALPSTQAGSQARPPELAARQTAPRWIAPVRERGERERRGRGLVWVCGRLGRSGRLDFAGQREGAAKSGSGGSGSRQRPSLRTRATKGPEEETKSSPAERSSQGHRPARGRLNGPEGPTQEQGKQKKRRRERRGKEFHIEY